MINIYTAKVRWIEHVYRINFVSTICILFQKPFSEGPIDRNFQFILMGYIHFQDFKLFHQFVEITKVQVIFRIIRKLTDIQQTENQFLLFIRKIGPLPSFG